MAKRDRRSERLWNILSDIDKVTSLNALDEISKAVAERRLELNKIRARELQRRLGVGDRIILTPYMKPRYLGEAEGVITRVFDDPKVRTRIKTKAEIRLDSDIAYRQYSNKLVTVSITAISKRTARGSALDSE